MSVSTLVIGGERLQLPRRPLIMGIVNLVADSFSGDGVTEIDQALEKAAGLIDDGADIIDIGAESARTNRKAMPEGEEIAQLGRFIVRWNELVARVPGNRELRLLLSINTWRPAVARAALNLGGDLLNDISGLPDDQNARICAESGAGLVIMHSVGEPKVPHTHVQYGDVMRTIETFFDEKIELAVRAGLDRQAIVLDPGIDFAKQREDNLRVYRELERLRRFERPILLPVSRKTVIGEVLDLPNPTDRDAGTIACIVASQLRGAAIVRVHNVRAAAQAVKMLEAIG